jgi:hypothetical protein
MTLVILEVAHRLLERKLSGGKHAGVIKNSPHEYIKRPHSFIFACFRIILKLAGVSL